MLRRRFAVVAVFGLLAALVHGRSPWLLAPVDLQAIKACGVTFVTSLLERVIEEQARGDKARAEALRKDILGLIGTDLSQLVPGSETAMKVKATLIERGVWSQYLEGYRQDMQMAESIHVRFLNHENTFKFWVRNDGAPWWRSALTPHKSSDTLSPFVTLAAR